MARIHAASFAVPRPWSASEIAEVMGSASSIVLTDSDGFLLGREVAGEAELLTLAVDPAARRLGTGETLVRRFIAAAKVRGADSIFLEVARNNPAATALYGKFGFIERGCRRGYYLDASGGKTDALILVLQI